ncbi:hypothetical protein ACS0TY_020312 [Phlomoides rotata]
MAPRKKLKAKGVVHKPHASNKNTQQENMVKESVDQVNEVEKDTIASGATFNVDHTRKKGCLSSAGVKWRQYKTTLTREYVYKRKTSPDLNIPPPKSGIDEIVWRDFVISRLSTNFMQMSDEHKKIVERNQLPHRLSRKGYARYALEHFSFIEQKKDGGSECEVEGGILSQALESKEHYGRLRGIGGVINPSTNFQHHSSKLSNPHLCKQYEIELIAQKKRNIEQDERIRRLEELVFKSNADKVETEELGSCSVKIQHSLHDDTPLDHSHTPVKLVGDDFDLKIVDEKMGLDNDDKLKGKSVALSLESSTDIVAYGTIIKMTLMNSFMASNFPRIACVLPLRKQWMKVLICQFRMETILQLKMQSDLMLLGQ